MTKVSKIYERLLQAPRHPLRFRDFETCLTGFGFVRVRTRGSHQVFEHPSSPRPLIVQPNGSEAKAYQQKEFLDMVRRYGLKPIE